MKINLTGTEKAIPVLGAYVSVKNNTSVTIYASNKQGIDVSSENVTPIQSGESVVIPNCDKAVYVMGTGEIAVESSNQLFNFFKSAPVGGGGGDSSGAVAEHNADGNAHPLIQEKISGVEGRVNALESVVSTLVPKLGNKNIDDIITLTENGVATPYIIKQKGKPSDMYSDTWNGGVLVTRLHAKGKRAWDADNVNDYENSDIDKYLNGSFLSELDPDIAAAIMTVKIPYKKGTGNDTTAGVLSSENGLARKVFPLSAYEVGFTKSDNQYISEGGAKLAGFSDANSRKCTDDAGNVVNWWLRSPDTITDYNVWYVHTGGSCSNANANYKGAAVRPSFVLPSNLFISSDGSVVGL